MMICGSVMYHIISFGHFLLQQVKKVKINMIGKKIVSYSIKKNIDKKYLGKVKNKN